MSEPIIINNFDQGISDSPHKGFGLMRNVNLDAFFGAVQVSNAMTTAFHSSLSATFTAVAATDVCTLGSGTTPITGTAVTVSSTGTLPAGLSASTNYFVINVSGTTFKLATNIANANANTAIDITDTGTGTHTVATVNPGQVNHITRDPRSDVRFYHDSNGRVWYRGAGSSRALLLNGNTITNSAGQGIITFQTSDGNAVYLFVFRGNAIDVVNVFGTSNIENPTWTTAWKTMNTTAASSNSHQCVVGQDNIIYFCDTRFVGSIKENAGSVFNPATAGTYTYNNQALDLPQNEVANWLDELGTNLMIAGDSFDKIYPWDRVSDSYNLPIPVPEKSIKRIKNIGNVIYILAGTWGNIYTTQGSYTKLAKKMPEYVTNNSQSLISNPITWGGIDAFAGALIFGISVQTSGNSGAYLLYPDRRLVMDNQPSTGSANVTAIYAEDNYYDIGYSSGADSLDTSKYANFQGVVQSGLYRVATKTEKGTYSVLELQLAKPATSGSVRIGYRTDTSSSFTTLSTFAADSTNTSFKNDEIGLIDIENLQVQLEFHGTVEIVEVRLLP